MYFAPLRDKFDELKSIVLHNFYFCKMIKGNDKLKRSDEQPNNPLHGVKLLDMLEYLVVLYGWDELGAITKIRGFTNGPTIKSTLKFLRTTPWAREKVEQTYLRSLKK